jgi:uncharacterized repeat protein (TIGR04052 family)
MRKTTAPTGNAVTLDWCGNKGMVAFGYSSRKVCQESIIMNRMLRPLVSVVVLASVGACGDDDTPSNGGPEKDAGVDASPGTSASQLTSAKPTSTSAQASTASSADASFDLDASASDASTDGGANSCGSIAAACAEFDDVDGLGNLCLRASAGADAEVCGALSDECLDFCQENAPPIIDAGIAAGACEAMGDRCHDLDDGHGLGSLCHDTGHAGNAVWCAAIYDECTALCGHSEPDHDGGPDASASDAGDGNAPSQSVTLNFRALFGDQDFACGQEYTDQGTPPTVVTPQDFRLYISDVRLINSEGVEVPFSIEERSPFQGGGVALLDFEDGSGACLNGNSEMNSTVTGTVPVGSYTGVVFSTSVPTALNHQDPTTLPAPLQAGNMTWGWLYGYKFIKAEVLQVLPVSDATDAGSDASADASAPIPGAGLFHLGSTGCSNETVADAGDDFGAPPAMTCTYPNRNRVELLGFNAAEDVIVADVAELFASTDLTTISMCHSFGEACSGLFENSGVDFATGAALDSQSLFRAE